MHPQFSLYLDAQSNPYHLALVYGLERIYSFLRERQQTQKRTHIIFECRGKKEDKDLELEFRRVCDGANQHFWTIATCFGFLF